MGRSDEESDNSSENSFNKFVTTTLARGVAMSMLMVPQAIAPMHYQPDLNVRQWVNNIVSDPMRCHINFCMQPVNFQRLHDIFTTYYGRASTRDVDSMEA
jgi:hypothetical protein